MENTHLKDHVETFGPPHKEAQLSLRRQALFAGYSLGISVFSPMMNLYQITRLNPGVKASYLRLCTSIYPQQAALRMVQVNVATPIKDNMNPWVAFAALGVLQGGIYGHANIELARRLGVGSAVKLSGIFRGSLFAFARDIISQGGPFMLSHRFSERYLDPVLPSTDKTTVTAKHWISVRRISVVAIYVSHGFHVCQTAMQMSQSLSYWGAMRHVYARHGIRFLINGAEARVGLLLVTNIFNEIFLKPAWGNR